MDKIAYFSWFLWLIFRTFSYWKKRKYDLVKITLYFLLILTSISFYLNCIIRPILSLIRIFPYLVPRIFEIDKGHLHRLIFFLTVKDISWWFYSSIIIDRLLWTRLLVLMKKLLAFKLSIIIKTCATVPLKQTITGPYFSSYFLEKILVLLSKGYVHELVN